MNTFTQSNFINFVYQTFGYYKQTHGNLEVVCPICKDLKGGDYHKQKFSINLDKKIGMCKCWVCGYTSSNLLKILKKYFPHQLETYKEKFHKAEPIYIKNNEIKQEVLTFPEGFNLLATSDYNDPYVKAAINYLKSRKIDLETDLWYWKFGITTQQKNLINRIIVPSFDASGEFNFFSARAWYKTKRKYNNPNVPREEIIFNELNLDWKSELILVEGVFDLVKCSTNATCLLGSELTSNYKLFEEIVINKTPVVLALDPDAEKKTIRLAERLFEFDVQVKILNIPKHFEDVGDMTKNQFINILDSAILFDADYCLRRKILGIV